MACSAINRFAVNGGNVKPRTSLWSRGVSVRQEALWTPALVGHCEERATFCLHYTVAQRATTFTCSAGDPSNRFDGGTLQRWQESISTTAPLFGSLIRFRIMLPAVIVARESSELSCKNFDDRVRASLGTCAWNRQKGITVTVKSQHWQNH